MTVHIPSGVKPIDALRAHSFFMPCGGQRHCGRCKVIVSTQTELPMTDEERAFLHKEEIASGVRLACFLPAAEMTVVLPDAQGISFAEGHDGLFAPRPGEKKALAVDVGTTTVAMALLDLAAGRVLDVASALNAQKSFGDDVMTRIGQARDGQAQALRDTIVTQLNELSAQLCARHHISAQEITRAVISGNTTMAHLLVGYPVDGLAQAPFTPHSYETVTLSGAELGLSVHPEAHCVILPCLGAFVGGDLTSGLLATRMHEREGVHMLVDIGTNGEMIIGGKNGLLGCSTAAGPALEGCRISCGTGAIEGAVCSVSRKLNGFETIGGQPAAGICGTGLVDLTAAL